MRTKNFYPKTQLKGGKTFEGESIEEQVRKMIAEKEPIESTSPIIFTPPKDGVLPQYDIRTDRWQIAQDTMDKVTASKIAKRDNYLNNAVDETTAGAQALSGDPSSQTTPSKDEPTN